MVERYKMPEQFNVEVKCLYKGEQIGADFFEKNPKIELLYPSKQAVLTEYSSLKQNTSKGMKSILEVSETGIKILKDISSL
jgi:hypothetical protein